MTKGSKLKPATCTLNRSSGSGHQHTTEQYPCRSHPRSCSNHAGLTFSEQTLWNLWLSPSKGYEAHPTSWFPYWSLQPTTKGSSWSYPSGHTHHGWLLSDHKLSDCWNSCSSSDRAPPCPDMPSTCRTSWETSTTRSKNTHLSIWWWFHPNRKQNRKS